MYLFEVITSSRWWSANNKVWVTLGPEVTVCQLLSLEENFKHRLTQSHILWLFSWALLLPWPELISSAIGSYQSFQNLFYLSRLILRCTESEIDRCFCVDFLLCTELLSTQRARSWWCNNIELHSTYPPHWPGREHYSRDRLRVHNGPGQSF